MTTTNGFFLEMSTFFRKMTTSNEVRDSILDVDDVQTSSNIYDADDDGQSRSIITPYLGKLPWKSKVPLQRNGMATITKIMFFPAWKSSIDVKQ